MKTILFPTDFSERAKNALAQAVHYAQTFKLKILIYHAYHRPFSANQDAEDMAGALYALENKIDRQFEKLQADIESLKTVEHEFRRELGVTIENIPLIAKNEPVDFIIMATKGANGLDELWGTKTAHIVEKVKVPVLVMPDNTTLQNIGKVGLVCDYSKETNYDSIDFLVKILKGQALDLDIITLNRNEKPLTSAESSYRSLVKKKLESIPAKFHFTFHNNVDEGIMQYSKSHNIGMIAILPKTYGFIQQIFHESLSRKMIFRSPIPLLILK